MKVLSKVVPEPVEGLKERRSGSDESGDGVGGLADLDIGLVATGAGGVDDAVREVLVEQLQGDGLERAGRRGDLGEDVDAVRVLLDHPGQAADLALDATEPGEDCDLVVAVAGGGVAHRRSSFIRSISRTCVRVMACARSMASEFSPSRISRSAMVTAPSWCWIMDLSHSRSNSVPVAAASWFMRKSLIIASSRMWAMPWPGGSGASQSVSQAFSVRISGRWVFAIWFARSRISTLAPAPATRSAMARACSWCGTICWAKSMSASLWSVSPPHPARNSTAARSGASSLMPWRVPPRGMNLKGAPRVGP